jgi:hypothetical protein
MLAESASHPTIHSPMPHQRQGPHNALTYFTLLAQRSAEIAVGLSLRTNYVSKAGHTLLSKRPTSVEVFQGDPTGDRELVDHCNSHDPRSSIAAEGSLGWRWEQVLARSTGGESWCSRGSR